MDRLTADCHLYTTSKLNLGVFKYLVSLSSLQNFNTFKKIITKTKMKMKYYHKHWLLSISVISGCGKGDDTVLKDKNEEVSGSQTDATFSITE